VAVEPKCQSSDAAQRGSDLPSVVDFFCLTRRQIRLSTAVHNSARFPYISPAGTLWAVDQDGDTWKADKIVDGGYFEAEGATTLTDILSALEAEWEAHKRPGRWDDRILPLVISIENDPQPPPPNCSPPRRQTTGCQAQTMVRSLGDEASTMGIGMQIANDVLAPPIGLWSSRTGRGAYAARALAVRLVDADWAIHRFNIPKEEGADPAMSWYLSRRSQRYMAGALCPPPGAPAPDLDTGLQQLGRQLAVPDLPARIYSGEGCASLRAAAAQ
jgi:hypothetical protein